MQLGNLLKSVVVKSIPDGDDKVEVGPALQGLLAPVVVDQCPSNGPHFMRPVALVPELVQDSATQSGLGRRDSHSARLTSEYTDQYITDSENPSCGSFTLFDQRVVNQFSLSVHSNIPDQYITNIPARHSHTSRIKLKASVYAVASRIKHGSSVISLFSLFHPLAKLKK